MATRVFTAADQTAFAELSGDRNPLHVDPVQARRFLFGDVAVHGLHTLLWALDRLCAADAGFTSLRKIRAFFDAPVSLGSLLRLDCEYAESGTIKGRVTTGGKTALRLTIEPAAEAVAPWRGRDRPPRVDCADPPADKLAGMSGTEPLSLPRTWGDLFPNLAPRFSPAQVAVLLAATRIVGMICPGLHSIFSGLTLSFERGNGSDDGLSYAVRRFDARVSLLEIDVQGGGARGALQAFRRPSPVRQPSFSDLAGHVAPDEFAGQRAMVVGGSRGLGELAAKLLALGGASVTVTFAQGAADAARIVAEGQAAGFGLAVRAFDVLARDHDPIDPPPTHLYYFATPRIPVGEAGAFDADRFAKLLDYYVGGLARTARWLAKEAAGRPCVIWTPSTSFLNGDQNQFPEYAAAKACAEALCVRLGAALPNIEFVAERLPPLPSDQTQSLVSLPVEDACQVILPALRALRRRASD